MASAPRRGYGALSWDHGRALEVEAELAAWLSDLAAWQSPDFTGRIFWTGAGPSIREQFKSEFPMNVFSTPDLVFVPEFYHDGTTIGWGEPFLFDATERVEYAWRGSRFPTVYAQVEKVDALASMGGQAYLAYKWKDGVWTFARVADIVPLKLKPKWVDTMVGGEKSKQKVYETPREVWREREEFKALMLEKIKDSAPIDRVRLLRMLDKARENDVRALAGLLEGALGERRFREIAKYYCAMQPMITWNPKRELEPSVYIMQRVFDSMLGTKRHRGGGNGEKTTDNKRGTNELIRETWALIDLAEGRLSDPKLKEGEKVKWAEVLARAVRTLDGLLRETGAGGVDEDDLAQILSKIPKKCVRVVKKEVETWRKTRTPLKKSC